MGMDPKAKYVAAALATAALGACSGASPTEPVQPPQAARSAREMQRPLGQLQRHLDGTTTPAPGVTLPQDPFGSFFHS
ncbi:MAG: hypothetical protein JWM27_1978 [Gemmatimonadetes bacterium]|nr:hypothetical protein [Gemmatimonadota bacterium]